MITFPHNNATAAIDIRSTGIRHQSIKKSAGFDAQSLSNHGDGYLYMCTPDSTANDVTFLKIEVNGTDDLKFMNRKPAKAMLIHEQNGIPVDIKFVKATLKVFAG